MKTLRILKNMAVVVLALLLINSCDKVETPEPMGDAGQTLVKLFPAGFKLIALDAVATSQKAMMFEVRRDVANETDLNTETNIVLKFKQSILDTFNAHNDMSLEMLETDLATVTPTPGADGSISLKFAFLFKYYIPVMLVKIFDKIPRNKIKIIGKIKRNFFILNKFLIGVKITNIKPIKLLTKKRG